MSSRACSHCGEALYPGQRYCARCGRVASGLLTSTPTPVPKTPPYATTPADSGAMLSTGALLDGGRYSIIRLLNAGSFGAVYEAMDHRLDDVARAVKELRDNMGRSLAEQHDVEIWFDREARLLMDLRHDMIPRFWDRFSQQGRHYLVMDLVPGCNLAQELEARGGHVPEAEVLEWGLALCGVLAYLHHRHPPLVFRDLKPANIMRTPEGMLYLIDFGIARGLAAIGPSGTQGPGTLIGTPGYSPPEMYQGLFEPASDIYALGATLYHLLTGYNPEQQRPFSFPPARRLRPDLQAETEEALCHALEMRPDERFADMQAIALALATAREKAALAAARPGTAQTATPAGTSSPPEPASVTPALASSTTASASSTPTLASFMPPALSSVTPALSSSTPTLAAQVSSPRTGVSGGEKEVLARNGTRPLWAVLGGTGAFILYTVATGWPPSIWPLFAVGLVGVGAWCLCVLVAEHLLVRYRYGASGVLRNTLLWLVLLVWAVVLGLWCLIALTVALQAKGGLDISWNLVLIMVIMAIWCGEPLRFYQRARTLRKLRAMSQENGRALGTIS